ncbi:MAG: phage virion morphogenesis protein [Panacagrimonas sp.]
MAGTRIFVNDARVLAALAELRKRGTDPSPVLRSIGEYLLRVHDQRFRDQRDPDGNPWAPLSEAYKKTKKRNADKVLSLDGFLRRLTYQVDADGLSLGTNRVYGAIHQFGASKGQFGRGTYESRKGGFPIPWGTIPARAYLGINAENVSYIAQELTDYLDAVRNI